MLLRILLVIFLGVGMAVTKPERAFGKQCKEAVHPQLRALKSTLLQQVEDLFLELRDIHSKEDLKVYLADPKDGGVDGRRTFFFIEVYSQVLRHYKKGEGIRHKFPELMEKTIRVMEDRFGKYSELLEVENAAISYRIGFPDEGSSKKNSTFIHYLESNSNQSLSELFTQMTDDGWLGKNPKKLEELKESIANLKWSDSVARDHKLFFGSLDKMFEAYQQKMFDRMKPLLKEKVWKYVENMEKGLHEVRRLFRWVMIIMQARREAFSYSKALDPQKLELSGLALEIAKKSLSDALRDQSSMVQFGIRQEGTAILSPESVFFISGLVDRIGTLKKASEIYFKLQEEILRFQGVGGTILNLKPMASREEVQQFIIEASDEAARVGAYEGKKSVLNLRNYFIAGDANPFQKIREMTLELLKPFWKLESLLEFKKASDKAKDYWNKQMENEP